MSACENWMQEVQQRFFATVDPKDIKTKPIPYDLQLDLFRTEEECEVDRLLRIVEEIKASTTKVRKKLFSENGTLKKKVTELEERLSILESGICRGFDA